MWLNELWKRWLGRTTKARCARPPVQLLLEQLEDRTVPANFTAASVSELIADMNMANFTAEGDTITLVAGKTFTLTAVNNTAHGATGLPTILAAGGSLTILGSGDVIQRSTAREAPAFRLFDVAAGGALTLYNLTLQGGLAFGFGVSAQGGAVYNLGTLTLNGVTVQNNTAQGGPGNTIYVPGPGGSAAGGGLYSNGVLTVMGGTIQNNAAIGGQGADSGRAYGGAPAGNGGNGLGGGAYAGGGTVTMQNTSITGNIAKGGQGGRYGNGNPGEGVAGGIYIDMTASVGLDAFTVAHIKQNKASSSDDNIHGWYDVIL
jgi:hypothetical protein